MRPFVLRPRAAIELCRALILAAAFAVALPALYAPAQAEQAAQGTAVFDEAWRLVRDHFYDRTMRGLDWDAVGNKYRPRYLSAATDKDRSAVINAMLDELNASHLRHFTPADPAYYQLVDIFAFGLRDAIPRHFPGGEISYTGIGIFTREIDGKTFVSGVMAGLPGEKGGLKVGDEIVAVDGAPFAPVASFRDKTARPVTISIRRDKDGPLSELTVVAETIKPGKAFEAATRDGARIIEANGRRIGYIHLWSYAGTRYQDALEDEISSGKLKDADALVWDLRDGWGGAHPNYLDIFNARGPDMTMTDRDGDQSIASYKWRRPAAVLINGGTRSGKEVLTYGFKKYGYGEVIGTRTAGALLAGRGFLLEDGSFLMIAVNDVKVDGERLEGKGVEPSIEVPFDLPYAAGRDPQLDKAVEVLSNTPRG